MLLWQALAPVLTINILIISLRIIIISNRSKSKSLIKSKNKVTRIIMAYKNKITRIITPYKV